MAMIKCSECNKEISDKAAFCVGCGAPISSSSPDDTSTQASAKIGDLNGDGKVDFEDFKIALSRSKEYAADKIDEAVNFGKLKLQSAKEKDAAAIEELTKSFEKEVPTAPRYSEWVMVWRGVYPTSEVFLHYES